MNIENNYIVYEVKYKDELVYIGSGKTGREQHVLSGKSNNVNLNRLYFADPENVTILVIRENLTKEEAIESERDFIMAAEPKFNTIHNPKNRKIKAFRKYTF